MQSMNLDRSVFEIAESDGLDETLRDLVIDALESDPEIKAVYSIGGGNHATFEFPESSSGGEALFGAVLGGVVGGVGVPAGPHDAEPGAGQDPDGVGVVLAASAGVGVQLGGPG